MKLKNIKFIYILAVAALLVSLFAVNVGAAETVVTMAATTVSGAVDQPITDKIITLNTGGDGFKEAVIYQNVSGWFKNLPAGLSAQVSATIETGAKTLSIRITGTPTVARDAVMLIEVPAEYINKVGVTDSTVTVNGAKWSILPTVTFSASAGGTIKATVDDKAISSKATVAEGKTVKFTATPSKGYKVKSWNSIAVATVTDLTRDIIMDTYNKTVTVEFEKISYYKIEELKYNTSDTYDFSKDLLLSVGKNITIKKPVVEIYSKDDVKNTSPASSDYKITVTSSNKNVVTVPDTDVTSGFEITVAAKNEGTATIKITVENTNENGQYIIAPFEKSFTVSVQPPDMELNAVENELTAKIIYNGTAKNEAVIIDFFAETLKIDSLTEKIYAYSVDGSAWVAFAEPIGNEPVNISAVLDKNNKKNVKFTNKALVNKKPAEEADVWVIGKIEDRPAAPKVAVLYGTGMGTGGNNIELGYWTLTGTGGTKIDLTTLLFATSEKGKVADANGSGTFGFKLFPANDPEHEDLAVRPLPDTGKSKKFSYLAKTNPDLDDVNKKFTPAGKQIKFSVSTELRVPKGNKVDYKKMLVYVKSRMMYNIDNTAVAFDALDDNEWIKATVNTGVKFEDIDPLLLSTAGTKMSVYIRTAPTGKAPWSEIIELKVNGPSNFTQEIGEPNAKGKYKLPKGLEVFDPVRNKWVKSIKITGNATYKVRQAGNAAYSEKDPLNNLNPKKNQTASIVKNLVITWGDIVVGQDRNGNDKIKQGVTNVSLTP